jgi:hypothetical protein
MSRINPIAPVYPVHNNTRRPRQPPETESKPTRPRDRALEVTMERQRLARGRTTSTSR